MPKCTSCSAPIPKSGIICEYCGTRNDIDLHDAPTFVNVRPHQTRTCPLCRIPLHTIDVGEKISFFIERCESCFGIFFDLHELETMIENSVKGSRNIDLKKLSQITEHPRHIDVIVYRHCPVCKQIMQRKNFMGRSGVITDVCTEHGVWLDSGELRQILEWVKTGGMERIKKEGQYGAHSRDSGYEKMPQYQRNHKRQSKHYRDVTYNKKSNDHHEHFDVFDMLSDLFFSKRW